MATSVAGPPVAPPDNPAASVVVAPGAQRYVRPFGGQTPARASWRYADAGRRDLRFDLLRGFAVFAMVVDHVGGDSWLYALTGGNRFFVSAAEGFVFISGLMVGVVYGDRLRREGFRATAGKLLARAWTLYALAIWLAVATAFFAAVAGLPRGLLLTASPARFIFEVITLRRTFYLVDVMLLYAFLLAIAPLALAIVRRGGWWLVLIASCALWGAYQAFPTQLVLPWRIADNPVFNFAPWQLLFFAGMLIGYGREWFGRNIVARFPRSPLRDGWAAVPLALFGVLICLQVTNGAILAPLVPDGNTAAWLDFWFDKSALPLPRLIACAIAFAACWLAVTRWWLPLRAALGWLLLPLGQRALYAYGAHLFIVAGVEAGEQAIWGPRVAGQPSPLHPGVAALVQLGAIGALWGLTRVRFLQDIVAPLGKPPFGAARWHWRRLALPRPSDSLAVVVVAALLTGLPIFPGGAAPQAGGASTPNQPGANGGAGVVPPPSTVTVPRSIGGNVRGSSGLTGRNDQQPTPAPGAGASTVPGAGASTAPRATVVPGASTAPGASTSAGGAPTAAPRATSRPGGNASPTVAGAVSGGYLKDGEFYSRTLGRTMPYGIYVPPSYESSPNRRYPVLYMLHGAGGHYSEWVAYGLPEQAEDLFWAGQIQPMIIVMPQGDQSYWSNHTTGDNEPWGDYIAYDLVTYIDANYRTLPTRASRAIGGLSMGGFGALQLAFNHPDIFGTVGGHSPALHEYEQMADIFADMESFEQNDPLALVAKLNPANAPEIWVDTGAGDEWAGRTAEMAQALDERGIDHQVHILPGRHDAEYWTSSTKDYLYFYSRAVTGGPPGPGR